MQAFSVTFKTDSTYTKSELEELREEIADALGDIDDEVDLKSVSIIPVNGKPEIDHEKIAREYLADNSLLENLNFIMEIEENGK